VWRVKAGLFLVIQFNVDVIDDLMLAVKAEAGYIKKPAISRTTMITNIIASLLRCLFCHMYRQHFSQSTSSILNNSSHWFELVLRDLRHCGFQSKMLLSERSCRKTRHINKNQPKS